jgi:hypothetical protein
VELNSNATWYAISNKTQRRTNIGEPPDMRWFFIVPGDAGRDQRHGGDARSGDGGVREELAEGDDMTAEPLRARVFISCGQSKVSDEVQIAREIGNSLNRLGFDTYIAVDVQDLHGLRENIFEQLRKTEYFLFVDFKRDLLGDSGFHRGSLFAHQELAIASLLEIDVVAFREEGVKPLDGLMQVLQVNAKEFSDKRMLPDAVVGVVQQRGWKSNWRNELVLEASPPVVTDAFKAFHVRVRNHHREKLAVNCLAYLESATKLPCTRIPLETIEFKWAATRLPSVSIAAGGMRLFDAFFIRPAQPNNVLFQVHTDTAGYVPQLPHEIGEYELSYIVRAENFPEARGRFILDLRSSLAETSFSRASE